jgi:hypothetical protein
MSVAQSVLFPDPETEPIAIPEMISAALPLHFHRRLNKYFQDMKVKDIDEMPIEVIIGLALPEDRIMMKCFLSKFYNRPIILWAAEKLKNQKISLANFIDNITETDKPWISSIVLANNDLTAADMPAFKKLTRADFPNLSLINLTQNAVTVKDAVCLKLEFPNIQIICSHEDDSEDVFC